MTGYKQPSYNIYFDRDDIKEAINCMNVYGFCVIRKMIDESMVEELKDSIDENLDPDRDLPPASNRYHMTFAEVSKPLWKLADHAPYMNFIHQVLKTDDLCLHRSAAILRTAGEPMGGWHTDSSLPVEAPKNANEMLNRYQLPSGSWFYLNGSHPERSGITVIEKSHHRDWEGPEGFEFTANRKSFHRIGEAMDADANYNRMDVPGCVAVIADPGDIICFADLTYHTNMATNERRYSCGIGFRPKKFKINAPWPLSAAAKKMIDRLPDHLKRYADGYTSFDGKWQADS